MTGRDVVLEPLDDLQDGLLDGGGVGEFVELDAHDVPGRHALVEKVGDDLELHGGFADLAWSADCDDAAADDVVGHLSVGGRRHSEVEEDLVGAVLGMVVEVDAGGRDARAVEGAVEGFAGAFAGRTTAFRRRGPRRS